MRVFKRIEKQVSQRKQAHSRGRPGLNRQMLQLAEGVFSYLLQVNAFLTEDFTSPEEAFSSKEELREAGVNLQEACAKWLAGE